MASRAAHPQVDGFELIPPGSTRPQVDDPQHPLTPGHLTSQIIEPVFYFKACTTDARAREKQPMTAQPVDTTPPTKQAHNTPQHAPQHTAQHTAQHTVQEDPQGVAQEAAQRSSWQVLDEPATVRFLPSGTPLALRWRGGIWQVIGNPVKWSSSSSWWEPATPPPTTPLTTPLTASLDDPPTTPLDTALDAVFGTASGAVVGAAGDVRLRGQGSVVTTRFWRFQAQTGPASPVLEFDMSADQRWPDWRLRRVATVNDY